MVIVIVVLTIAILWVSLMPNAFIGFTERAAAFLLDRNEYINAVLNR